MSSRSRPSLTASRLAAARADSAPTGMSDTIVGCSGLFRAEAKVGWSSLKACAGPWIGASKLRSRRRREPGYGVEYDSITSSASNTIASWRRAPRAAGRAMQHCGKQAVAAK